MKSRQMKRRFLIYGLYLLLACVMMMGVTYGRYTSTVTGTATATVARVELNSTADLSNALKGIKPGDNIGIDVKVSNMDANNKISEVTQDYSITIDTTGNLPLKFTLAGKNTTAKGTYVNTTTLSENTGNQVVWSGGQMPHSEIAQHEYTLNVTWEQSNNNDEFANEIDCITLTIDAKQTQ